MNTYYWYITSSGSIEANSKEEAQAIIEKDKIGYAMDDLKYSEVKIVKEEDEE